MQTVPPTLRLAVAAMVSVHRNGCFNTSQPHDRRLLHWLGASLAKRRTCHRFWAPGRRRALRLPTKQLHHCCSPLAAPRNVAQPCKASSSLALRACGKAASQFVTRRAKAQRLHNSQHSGGCNQQASWPITVSASYQANTSGVQSGRFIACQRRECAA